MSIQQLIQDKNYNVLVAQGSSLLPLFGDMVSPFTQASIDSYYVENSHIQKTSLIDARQQRVNLIRSFLTVALLVTSIVVPAFAAVVVPLWIIHSTTSLVTDLLKIYRKQSSILPVVGKTAIKSVIIGLAAGGVIIAAAAPFMALTCEAFSFINHFIIWVSSNRINPANILHLCYLRTVAAIQESRAEPLEFIDANNTVKASDNPLVKRVLYKTLITNPKLLLFITEYYKLPYRERHDLRYDMEMVKVQRALNFCKSEERLRRLKESPVLVDFARDVAYAGKNRKYIPWVNAGKIVGILQTESRP